MTDTKATDIAARLRAVQRRIAKAAVQFHAAWSNPDNSEIGYLLEEAAKDMPDPDALAECADVANAVLESDLPEDHNLRIAAACALAKLDGGGGA